MCHPLRGFHCEGGGVSGEHGGKPADQKRPGQDDAAEDEDVGPQQRPELRARQRLGQPYVAAANGSDGDCVLWLIYITGHFAGD